ncbi:hypothetical protein ABAC460_23125 [Asticcacaulis sp. AC460]|nr:hypothetical protein ABAC460_23125 [Asticcacaulis sp. AC460]
MQGTTLVSRAAVEFKIKPLAGTYNLTFKFGDQIADQVLSAVAINSTGYPIPIDLNGRFITDIFGVAA